MTRPSSVLLVHGAFGNPDENWMPWLRGQMESKGLSCITPTFPTPDGQNFDNWRSVFIKATINVDPTCTIMVGHSIGCAFLLSMVEEAKAPYHTIACVCPFVDLLQNEVVDPINATFVKRPFKWEKIKRSSTNRFCYAGDNDPYVALPFSQKVADALETPLSVIPRGGHINKTSGFLRFDKLLEDLNTIL